MTSNLRDLKRRVSPVVLAIPGVSGIGLPGGQLTIYLVEDSDAVRARVTAALRPAAGDLPIRYVVTGALRAS